MKLINVMLLAFLSISVWEGEKLTVVSSLDDSLEETSGLLYFDEKILSIDDAHEPVIHEIDSLSGSITRSVTIENAKNHDWEDIAQDEDYLYIADIGNNFGKRKGLKIYRVSKEEYRTTKSNSVTADIIHYNYADQTDFSSALFSTNFDAEALIVYGDSLYVFTKNWGDLKTNVYAIPKVPGKYEVEKIDTLQVKGLITGAVYDRKANKVLLSGNSFPSPFVIELQDFDRGLFSNGNITRHKLQPPVGYSLQVEGITLLSERLVYLAAEKNLTGKPALYQFDLSSAPL